MVAEGMLAALDMPFAFAGHPIAAWATVIYTAIPVLGMNDVHRFQVGQFF